MSRSNNSNHNGNHHRPLHDVGDDLLQQLEDTRSELSRADAIIDHSAIQTLRSYPSLSNQCYHRSNDSAILKKYLLEGQSLLSDGYCGYTKICNLLLDWMKNIQDPKTINNTFIRILKKSAIELYQEQHENNTDAMDVDNYRQQMIKDIDDITKSYGDTAVLQRGFSLFEFQDKFKNHLQKICCAKKGTETDYDRKIQRLVTYCTKNELHYLYSRRLLAQLRESNAFTMLDYALSKIESKLDDHTNSKLEDNCNKIKELSIYAKGIEFQSELRVPSVELLRKGSFTKADITKVYNYYHSHYKHNKMVKLRFLQNKHMINYLYHTLFIPCNNFKVNKTYLSQYIFLLNYALFEGQDHNRIHKDEFDANIDILSKLTEICRDRSYGVTLSEDGDKQNILFNGIRQPGIARGILIWINHCMYIKSETYFNENFETYLTPLLVALVADITTLHLFLRPKVALFAYNMIYNIGDQTTSTLATKSAASFDAKTTSFSSIKNMEVIKTMLDIIVYIIQLGEFVLVFDIINKRPNDLIKLDRSLHRHFITQIIKTCNDPLPDEFILNLFQLLKHNQIIAAIRNDMNTANMVQTFVNNHKDVAPSEADIIVTEIKLQNNLHDLF